MPLKSGNSAVILQPYYPTGTRVPTSNTRPVPLPDILLPDASLYSLPFFRSQYLLLSLLEREAQKGAAAIYVDVMIRLSEEKQICQPLLTTTNAGGLYFQ